MSGLVQSPSVLEQERLERLKAELAQQLEERKGKFAENIAMFNAAASYAGAAMRGLLFVNGGGIVGILTFLGNLSRSGAPPALHVVSKGIHAAMKRLLLGTVCDSAGARAVMFGADSHCGK